MTRRTNTQRRSRGQLGKRLLLPLPRTEIEQMSLQYHAALEAIHMKQGSAHGMRILLQIIVLTGFIDEARRQDIRVEALIAAERGIQAAFERGEHGRTGIRRADRHARFNSARVARRSATLGSASLAVLMEAVEAIMNI